MSDYQTLEKKIGYEFTDKELLNVALTHRSYLNEHGDINEHNERLEFLGDAVLELIVTEYLYHNFSNPEGELTNWRSSIVRGEVLSKVARKLNVGEYLRLSKGEEKSGGRTRNLILANCLEAIIGAIYLDSNYDEAKKFIHNHLIVLLPEIIEKKLYLDPKSYFQELTQEKKSITPEYKVMEESGPDHDKRYVVGVYLGKDLVAQGEGSSKQKAEVAAASEALKKFKE